jgi:energy-coupling factor transporter ATP-binding protein EcfA2
MIAVAALRFRYRHQTHWALDGVSLDIPTPGVYLLSGPTGCGKSTLALALTGAIPQVIKGTLAGTLEVAGLEPARTPLRHLSRKVGLLLQNVEGQMVTDRVEDEVAFGLENLALAPSAMPGLIHQALEAVDAASLRDRALLSLSAGERQRVMLAAMLAMGQEVLILDEPLAYLDRAAGALLLDLAGELARRGKTLIFMEHRRQALLPLVKKEFCLNAGRLVAKPAAAAPPAPLSPCAAAGKPVIAIEGISFGYEPRQLLLQDLSFELHAAQSAVLLGDNGAGKTTLLKLLVGLLTPAAGRIRLADQDLSRLSPKKLAPRVALVLQNPDHQLRLPTVIQEVSWGAATPAAAAQEIQALGLSGLEERHPHSLSSGQKRRVTLAAALARRPQVLLLDEPTVGQDDANLWSLLHRLGTFVQGGGVLLTASHDQRAARFLGQKVLVLEKGRAFQGDGDLAARFFA